MLQSICRGKRFEKPVAPGNGRQCKQQTSDNNKRRDNYETRHEFSPKNAAASSGRAGDNEPGGGWLKRASPVRAVQTSGACLSAVTGARICLSAASSERQRAPATSSAILPIARRWERVRP